MSVDSVTDSATTPRPLSRRNLLKTTGAVAGALAAGSLSKASPTFAAPAVLQGETINLKYMTWFWWEEGRA